MTRPGVNSVTVPVLSVVVVVVSVAPLVPDATEVVIEDVCPNATEPIRAVANVTLRNQFNHYYFLLLSYCSNRSYRLPHPCLEEAWEIR